MPRSLPFTAEPVAAFQEIGTDETGKLRFRKIKGISIPERLIVKEVDHNDDLFLVTAELCEKIQSDAIRLLEGGTKDRFTEACSQGLTVIYLAIQQVLEQLVQTGYPQGDGIGTEIALRYPTELQTLRARKIEISDGLIVRKATTMIRTRLDGTTAEWTDEDTIGLDNEWLIVQIALFYGTELQGLEGATDQTLAQQLSELEAALGKLQGESGSNPPSPTGPSSTGSVEVLSQEPLSSPQTPSGFSPTPTSSKRQKSLKSAS